MPFNTKPKSKPTHKNRTYKGSARNILDDVRNPKVLDSFSSLWDEVDMTFVTSD